MEILGPGPIPTDERIMWELAFRHQEWVAGILTQDGSKTASRRRHPLAGVRIGEARHPGPLAVDFDDPEGWCEEWDPEGPDDAQPVPAHADTSKVTTFHLADGRGLSSARN